LDLAHGIRHLANMSDPKIPAALADVVTGVVSLHDFRPHTNFKPRANFTFSNNGGTALAVVPADLAKIYNLNPLFSSSISGQNQTVVVVEDSDVSSTADWTTFRSTFCLVEFFVRLIHADPSSAQQWHQ
jgi:subtilase family serine protease